MATVIELLRRKQVMCVMCTCRLVGIVGSFQCADFFLIFVQNYLVTYRAVMQAVFSSVNLSIVPVV